MGTWFAGQILAITVFLHPIEQADRVSGVPWRCTLLETGEEVQLISLAASLFDPAAQNWPGLGSAFLSLLSNVSVADKIPQPKQPK